MNSQTYWEDRETKNSLIKKIFCMFFLLTLICFTSKSFAGFPIGNEVIFYDVEQEGFSVVWQVDTASTCTVNVYTGQDGSDQLVPGVDPIVINSITNASNVFQSRGIMEVEVSGLTLGTEYFVQTSSTDSTGTHLYPDFGNLLPVKTETYILAPPIWENGRLYFAIYGPDGITGDPTQNIIPYYDKVIVLVETEGANYPLSARPFEFGTGTGLFGFRLNCKLFITRNSSNKSQWLNWTSDTNDHPITIRILGGATPSDGLGYKTINKTYLNSDEGLISPCLADGGNDIAACYGDEPAYINQIILFPNNPPDFDLNSVYYVDQNVTLTIHLCASDPEGDQIAEFSLINAPEGMGIQFPDPGDPNCAIITWTSSVGGISRDIQVTVSDGKMQTSKTFMVAVHNGPPSTPEVSIGPIHVFDTDNLICTVDPNTILNPDPNDTIYLDFIWYKAGISVPIIEELNTTGKNQSILDTSYTEIGGEYYCVVTARDKDGSADPAMTNSIIVMEAPLIKILYPNGEEIIRGTTQIQWETYEDANNLDEIKIDIFYSSDHGNTWNLISMDEGNDGSYEWHIDTLPDGIEYLIKLIYKVNGEIKGEDISDDVFSIFKQNTPPQIQDIVVNQETDKTVKITYRCLDYQQTTVDIYFKYWDGAIWKVCYILTGEGVQLTNVPLTAFWMAKYDLPDRYLTDCQIRIFADDGEEINHMAITDSSSFILDTKSPMTSPNPKGGIYDSPQTVILSASDDSDISAIYYTTDSSDPTTESILYTNPIIIKDNTSLKFFAIDSFGNQEPIRTEEFVIRKQVDVSVSDPTCAGDNVQITCQYQYQDGNIIDSDLVMFTISIGGSATFDSVIIEGELIDMNDSYNSALVRTAGGRVIMTIRDDVAEDVPLFLEDTQGFSLEFPAFDYNVTTIKQDIDSFNNIFTFYSTPPPAENGVLTVHAQGDLDLYNEFFTLYAESTSGANLGDVFRYGGISCSSEITDSIIISQSNLNDFASDGIITIIAEKGPGVDSFCEKNTIFLSLKYRSFGSIPRFLDPNLDEDGDGLLNGLECSIGLNVNNPDTDEDGLPDGYEYERSCLDPMDNGSMDPNHGLDGDPDNDGLNNFVEHSWNTEPCVDDTDEDGISDGEEYGYDPNTPKDDDEDGIINPLDLDSDNDGLSDSVEYFKLGTDYTNPDTDGDGFNDQFEVGTDPNHAALCDCNGVLCPCVFDPNNILMEYTLTANPNKFFSDLTLHFKENIQWQNGHYIMYGDIRIENEKILRIGEGVILKFIQRDSLLDLEGGNSGLVDFIIDGKLLIQGNPNNMVLFTSIGLSSCIFFDDMENGSSKWYTEEPWGIVSTDSYLGTLTNCWTDSPYGSYSNYEDSLLSIKDPLDFSNIQEPYLHFWIKYDSELCCDYLSVGSARDNRYYWQEIEQYGGYSSGWEEKTVNLSQYSGYPNVYIVFYFHSDPSVVYNGFYIDDIGIYSGISTTLSSPGDWGGLILTSSSDPNSTIQYALIEFGKIGISVFNSSSKIGFNQIRNSLDTGIRLYNSNSVVKNNLITNNGKGIFLYSSNAQIINNTFYGNGIVHQVDPNYPQILCHDSSPNIVNNIISNGRIGLTIKGVSKPKVSYNDFYQSVTYWNCNEDIEFENTIIDPNLDPIPGGSQIYENPMFQAVGQNNYRLQCPSPCIDAGDPNSDYSQEPEPNGGRINIGAYGGTPKAYHTDLLPPDPNDCFIGIQVDSIHIDPNGKKYTNSPTVDLNISAYDECGISLMQLKNEDSNWSDPVKFANIYRSWQMNTKKPYCNIPCKVYIRFSDMRNNWSDPIYDTIIYDIQPPHICSVAINEGVPFTNSTLVNLNIQAEDNCGNLSLMRISKNGQDWTPHQLFQHELNWNLENRSCSNQSVYVMIFDRAGNKTVCTSNIQLDMDLPGGSILINNGDLCTNSCTVILDVSGEDACSSVNLIGLSNIMDLNIHWLEVVSSPNNIILENWNLCTQDSFDGEKIVSAIFIDEAGNKSAMKYAFIELDREKPDCWAFINYGDQETCSANVTLKLATDSDDIVSIKLSNNPNWTEYQEIEFSGTISWNLCAYGGELNQGEKTVYIKSYDNCGNESLTDAHISLTCSPPSSFTMDNSSGKPSTDLIYYKDNIIWDSYYNAYVISGDIVIESFETLRIGPDTEIMFTTLASNKNYRDTHSNYSNYCELIVKGDLTIEGQEDKKVKFTVKQIAGRDPFAGDWGGIILYPSSSVKLEHTIIEYAINGIYILNDPNYLRISQCTIRNNQNSGLYCRLSSPVINGFDISENYYGIFCDSSSPRIYNNVFSNYIKAVYISPHSDPNLSCNNQRPNQFLDSPDILAYKYAIYNDSGKQIAASHNQWETNDPNIISLLIFDKEDDPNKGIVDLYPLLGQIDSGKPTPKKEKQVLFGGFLYGLYGGYAGLYDGSGGFYGGLRGYGGFYGLYGGFFSQEQPLLYQLYYPYTSYSSNWNVLRFPQQQQWMTLGTLQQLQWRIPYQSQWIIPFQSQWGAWQIQ